MKTKQQIKSTNLKVSDQAVGPAERVMEKYFERRGKHLLIGGCAARELIAEFGSPLYAYDKSVIHRKIAEARALLTSRFDLFYSIKANPNAAVLKLFVKEGCGLEISSGGELHQALAAGCLPERILFAGPGKSDEELSAAIEAGIFEIHVESLDEAMHIDRLSAQHGGTTRVALRINPIDGSGGAMRMGGKPSPFGIDEENIEETVDELLKLENLSIAGVHLFMGTQILDAEILADQYRRAVTIASDICERVGPLETIDFGGGWGTPYFAHENKLDLEALAGHMREIDAMLAANPRLANARAIIEPGRFLVNEAGVYLTTVRRIKKSRGKTFAIVDGGMHHHLAASGNLGQAIKRNYPMAVVNRLGEENSETTDIVGPLCTPLDTIGRNVLLPPLQPGDIIGVFLSGAYARTASPHSFLSHQTPAEALVGDGKADLIRRRGILQDLTGDQIEIA